MHLGVIAAMAALNAAFAPAGYRHGMVRITGAAANARSNPDVSPAAAGATSSRPRMAGRGQSRPTAAGSLQNKHPQSVLRQT